MQQIDIDQVKELIDKQDVVVVDIRDPNAFEQAHIQQAIHVHDGNVEEFVKTADKNKPLICYCYHGHSSQSAARYFQDAGFKTVYSMIGGFEAWREKYL